MSTQYGYRRRDRDSERRAIAPRRRRLAPELMALEDRRLPAMMIHVTSAADSGPGTLRAAVEAADAATGPVKIDFQLPADSTITLTSGQLELSNVAEPVAIDGPGDGLLTISGGGDSRVFQVDPGVTASISGLTLTGGTVLDSFFSEGGGDVGNQGNLTLTGVKLSGGNAIRGDSLFNSGSVTLLECTVTGNSDPYRGAMYNRGGSASMTLIGCDVSGNGSLQYGAETEAIGNFAGKLFITGSTLRGNGYGPVVNSYGGGNLEVSDTIISGNGGVGLATQGGGSLILTDSSITENGGNGLVLLGANAMVARSTISGNYHMFNGAVMEESGTLSMTGCTISGNQGIYGTGGLNIGAYSTVTLSRCAIVNNSGPLGGIYTGGQTTLTDCTISGNSATTDFYHLSGLGGGIFAYSYGPSLGDLTLNACTISGNTAAREGGGGLYVQLYSGNTPQIILNDTIIAGNTTPAGPADIAGQAAGGVTGSYNLVGTGGSGGLSAADHNLPNVADPGLAPLGDYGGPTETMALQPDSPARHAGAAAGVTTDQRGFPLDSPPDIGAFQSHPGPLVVDTVIDGLGSGPGQLSLRQAVNLSNVLKGGDSLTFDKSAFASKSVIILTAGQLELSNATGPVAILGPGLGKLAISGGGAGRVFQVDEGVSASLSGLTITGGVTSGDGGGLLNQGTVILSGDAIVGNSAADGGGLASSGTAVILGSSIDGNSATADGGGVFNTGFLSLTLSDLSANLAGTDGGGLYNRGTAALVFSTVDDNSSSAGGGIYADPSGRPVVLLGTQVKRNQGSNTYGRVIRI